MKCIMIILNYNDGQRAVQQAQRCAKFSCINKVILVDNMSTDNSRDLISSVYEDKIDYVFSEKNKGFAVGNNIGARYALQHYEFQYILFANTDTIFREKDVLACLECLEKNKSLGLISMRMKDIKGNEEKAAWRHKHISEMFLWNFWLYRHMNYKKDSYTYNDKGLQYVDVIRGSFMLFRKDAFQKAGMFDEGTFLFYEEDIISFRLQKNRYKIGILTNYFYIHNHIQEGVINSPFIRENYRKSRYFFLEKYYNLNRCEKLIFILLTFYSRIEENVIEIVKKYFGEINEK